MGHPTIHPTGTIIYNSERTYNGYTLFPLQNQGAILIDMNGNVVRLWKELHGFPNKLLPNGQVMGHLGVRNPDYGHQDQTDLVQIDWDGNVIWKFDHLEYIEDPQEAPQWMARHHQDY